MSDRFEKLKKEWVLLGYDGLIQVPLETNISFNFGKKHIIHHRGVPFVWINGNKKYSSFVVLPIKNYSLHTEISTFNFDSYDTFLEYISLLSFRHPDTQIDVIHRSFKNYFSYIDSVDTQKPFYPRCSNILKNIDVLEFKSNSLTEKESLSLSFFRDGMNLNNIFYSFLSFYKILELYFPSERRKNTKGEEYNDFSNMYAFIDSNSSEIKKISQRQFTRGFEDYRKFFENYEKFKKSGKKEIGEYLKDYYRNAVSHSILNSELVKASNKFNDYDEMYYANQFIKAVAYFLISKELKTEIIFNNLYN